ncbi:acetolactate synthase large subunit [Hydrogenophaga sp. 5NK40-0174]|uniref:acetolactate synthase large subunit n=1 Tax=Hydrogenophaga sp. 5NK40-0174 TaxID=3127649 RepID=UPI00333FD57D
MNRKHMTGGDALVSALADEKVGVCFANPGTTELDLVRSLEREERIRCVIGLQENVCTGGADGYGRMTGRPSATLLHLGPGFANGIANLHNARRAHTPIVNLIGDHTTWHLPYDAPLTSDIESLARPVSGWVHRIGAVEQSDAVAREAVKRSLSGGGQGATLIVPADFQAQPAGEQVPLILPASEGKPSVRSDFNADAAVQRLKKAGRIVFLLGGGGELSGLGARAQKAVQRICTALGASAFAETFPSRSERGQGLPAFDRLPYFPEPARDVLDPADLVVLVGALPPVTYFGYEGHPSLLVTSDRLLTLAEVGEDAAERLESVARLLGAGEAEAPAVTLSPPEDGPLTPARIALALANELPAQAIVSVEGGTCGYPFYAASAGARPHTTLTNTGGAIGQGLPVAMGAAVACPDRKVVALLSDGSTQYTIQTLWSLAHEDLDVLVLIAANHQYAILRNELRRGGAELGRRAAEMTSLENPCIDWVMLAGSYGVPGGRASTTAELLALLRQGFSTRGPMLIEMAL